MTSSMTFNRHENDNYVIIASLKSKPTCKLINRIPGSRLLISRLPGSALRMHVELLSKPRDSTRHSPTILYLYSTRSVIEDNSLVFMGDPNES